LDRAAAGCTGAMPIAGVLVCGARLFFAAFFFAARLLDLAAAALRATSWRVLFLAAFRVVLRALGRLAETRRPADFRDLAARLDVFAAALAAFARRGFLLAMRILPSP
jgi:1,4-dihydroxy-2-naphthoate octaprenyltransferase